MTALAILVTIGRFRIHWVKSKTFGWDDYLNGIALIFLLVFTVTYQIYFPIDYQAQLYSLGLVDQPPKIQDVYLDMKIYIANAFMFFGVIYSVKASFLALYWKIFHISNKFRIAWWFVTVYTVLSFLLTFFSLFWQCGSLSDFGDPRKIN